MAIAIVIGIAVAAAIMLGLVNHFTKQTFPIDSEAEAIRTSNAHIWVSNNGSSSIAGLVVESVGSKPVSIEKIAVRGQIVPVGSWYYNNDPYIATPNNIKKELTYDDTLDRIEVTGDGDPEQFTRATGPLSLRPGQAMFLYLINPADISSADSGQGVTLNVEGGKANWVVFVYVTDS